MTAKRFIKDHPWYQEDMTRFVRDEWWFYPEDLDKVDEALPALLDGIPDTPGASDEYRHRRSRREVDRENFISKGFIHIPSLKRKLNK